MTDSPFDGVTHLLWVDLETSGTDEHRNSIIEIGWIATGVLPPFHEHEAARASELVRPPKGIAHERLLMNDVVLAMHLDNGLLGELEAAGSAAAPAAAVAETVIGTLKDLGIKSHEAMLAGSGVGHFDRRFLKAQMPELDAYLAYPVFDIGVVRRFFQAVEAVSPENPRFTHPDPPDKSHRALDDILGHLFEAQTMASRAMGLAEASVPAGRPDA